MSGRSLNRNTAYALRALLPSLTAEVTKSKPCPGCGAAIGLRQARCKMCKHATGVGHQGYSVTCPQCGKGYNRLSVGSVTSTAGAYTFCSDQCYRASR